jgi:hypothetical protein
MAVTPSPTPQYMILTTIWLYLILKQWLLLLTNNQLQHVVVNMTMQPYCPDYDSDYNEQGFR